MSTNNVENRHLRAVPVDAAARPYNLGQRLERDVAYWSCASGRFFSCIGLLIDPTALVDPSARLLVEHAQHVFRETEKPPIDVSTVIGSIVRFREAGKVGPDESVAANDYYEAASDHPGDEMAVLQALAPIIQRRKQSELVDRLIKTHMGHGDIDPLVQALRSIPSIGRTDHDPGMLLGADVFQDIDKLRHIDRLSLGISELDMATEGGLGRSQLCVAMGKAGDGKSMFLVNVAAKALCCGLDVAVASLELEETVWIARLLSNLTGVPTNQILHGQWASAERKLANLQNSAGFGRFIVKWFPPRSTRWSEVRGWLEGVRTEWGNLDLFETDYADKILPDGRHDGTYGAMGEVYEEHRLAAVQWSCWAVTASQKKSGVKGKADVDDASDSANKGRVADMMLDLEAQDEGDGLLVRVIKNRHGPSRMEIGPLTTDWGKARPSISDVHTRNPGDPIVPDPTDYGPGY